MFSVQGSLFLPFFLIGAGAVLFFNGSIIYVFYQRQSNVNLICIDNLAVSNLPYHIHREFRFVPIEFAGVVMSSLFYVSLHALIKPWVQMQAVSSGCMY